MSPYVDTFARNRAGQAYLLPAVIVRTRLYMKTTLRNICNFRCESDMISVMETGGNVMAKRRISILFEIVIYVITSFIFLYIFTGVYLWSMDIGSTNRLLFGILLSIQFLIIEIWVIFREFSSRYPKKEKTIL